ncbi:gene transfer agent family protein [Paremcibacter congregatus]|uniref:gene transfer agent family protein n=1 Tax=Paremcibacter congregatus TaxID=2043170 RepID=UPI003A933740
MTANTHRGEIAVKLGGVQRVLRPTFTALSQIETITGKTIQELTAHGIACALSLNDMATILHCGLVASGDPADRAQVGQWVIDGGGAVEFYQPVGMFLVYGLTGGRDAEDDPDQADQADDTPGEPMPGRAIRSGGWWRWPAGVWAGLKRAFGGPPRTN